MRSRLLISLLPALAMSPGFATAAERVCEQSEATVTPAPNGRLAASVQHQVCATESGGVAAAVTVFIGDAAAPQQGSRMVMIAVPRSRDEWPQAIWRGNSSLEVWVPNLAKVLEANSAYKDVAVTLKYCADDPGQRARVAQHQADIQLWMAAVTRWSELRKADPEGAGPRPPRPAEPDATPRACSKSDIPPLN